MSELLERLLSRDVTLWPEGNVAPNRLGWLDVAAMQGLTGELEAWANDIGPTRVVLLGMGGSSLGPLVLGEAAGNGALEVVDTTDPRTVAAVDFSGAFVVVSSKSGTTLEVEALLAHAAEQQPDPSRYAVVTDPGSALAAMGRQRGYRVFENPPDIGGRYSVLSLFGLVPAALIGYDLRRLLESAMSIDREEAVALGIAMGEAAAEGRDKVTIRTAPAMWAFGAWVEQLIAESTGKHGRGCIPVPTSDAEDGDDRFKVSVGIGEAHQLGAEFLRWEIATAVAGHVLDVDPFDEPNVAESKANTARVLESLPLDEADAGDPASAIEWLRGTVRDGDYVSLQAYLPYDQADGLTQLRRRVRDELGGMAVTAGFGPRFLHSTGQLHKGGPNSVVAVQIVPRRPTTKLDVPGRPYDFATLIGAQATGDLESLRTHGRRVIQVGVDHLQEIG